MLPELKQFPVTWKDGMKISAQDFISMDDATYAAIRDVRSLIIGNNFGLLPPTQAFVSPFDYEYPTFQYSHYQDYSTIILEHCRAILPNGIRIEITPDNIKNNRPPYSKLPSIEISITEDAEYDILLEVYEDGREKTGIGEEKQDPPRYANNMLKAVLRIAPLDSIITDNHIPLAQIAVEDGQISRYDYLPPSIFVCSHPQLMKLHDDSLEKLRETLNAGIKILAEDKDYKFLADKLTYFIASSLDYYETILPYRSVREFFNYFKQLASITDTYIEAMATYDNQKERFLTNESLSKCKTKDGNNLSQTAKELRKLAFNADSLLSATEKIDIFVGQLHHIFRTLISVKIRRAQVEEKGRRTENKNEVQHEPPKRKKRRKRTS